MRKIIYILLLLFPLSFAIAQESEPEFVKLLKERFTIPEVAERACIEAEILLKVNKTAHCDSVLVEHINSEIYLQAIKTILNDTLWRKSLILGNYYIHLNVIASIPFPNNKIEISKDKSIIDSITQNSKTYLAQFNTKWVNSQRALIIAHDSLLSLYYTNPEVVWNSEKKSYDFRNKTEINVDSGDVQLEIRLFPSFYNGSFSYQLTINRDSSIKLKKIIVRNPLDSSISYLVLTKDRVNSELYKDCLRILQGFRTLPFYDYVASSYDGIGNKMILYSDGFIRDYDYISPESVSQIKIYVLFSNIKENYLSLFEF